VHDSTDQSLSSISFRADPDDVLWVKGLKPRAGYSHSDILRALLHALHTCCGKDDVPIYPFDISLSVRMRDTKRIHTAAASDPRYTTPKPYHLPDRDEARAAEDREPLTEPTPHARRQASQSPSDHQAHS
jgi:hypothetical protein